MAKIKGYLTAHDDNGPGYELGSGAGFGNFWEGDVTKVVPGALPVTLITEEPAYTATEVRAKDQDLTWAMTWMKNEAAHLRRTGTPQPALEMAVDMVIKRHGLSIESDADVMGMAVPKSDHA